METDFSFHSERNKDLECTNANVHTVNMSLYNCYMMYVAT